MIAIHPNHREFHDDTRYSELRERESARLAMMREMRIADVREAFFRCVQPYEQKPAYPDYIGDFSLENKNPFNTVLRELYSEELDSEEL